MEYEQVDGQFLLQLLHQLSDNRQIYNQMKSSKQSYKTLKSIGKGSFGQVDLVQCKNDGKRYVMKVFGVLCKKIETRQDNKESIMKEVSIMRQLNHQYIIRFYDSFFNEGNHILCIVMEEAENGQLDKYLKKRKELGQPLTEGQAIEWFIQLCLGLKYIHDRRILHRDLKCENIFINAHNQLKIGDFGISKEMKQTFEMASTKIGTPMIMAPEIWNNKKYNQKSDIWSLGCILYKLLTLNNAFEAQNTGSYILKITTGKYAPVNGDYSKQLISLLKQMLSLEAQKRPSVHSILQRKFIKKRVQHVLDNSLKKYQQNLLGEKKNKQNFSNPQILSKKRSFSSLSNSSMLTPKHSKNLENTKMVEMKQSYPILIEEVKKLRKQTQCQQKNKQDFVEQIRKLIEQFVQKQEMGKSQFIQNLDYRLTQYLCP